MLQRGCGGGEGGRGQRNKLLEAWKERANGGAKAARQPGTTRASRVARRLLPASIAFSSAKCMPTYPCTYPFSPCAGARPMSPRGEGFRRAACGQLQPSARAPGPHSPEMLPRQDAQLHFCVSHARPESLLDFDMCVRYMSRYDLASVPHPAASTNDCSSVTSYHVLVLARLTFRELALSSACGLSLEVVGVADGIVWCRGSGSMASFIASFRRSPGFFSISCRNLTRSADSDHLSSGMERELACARRRVKSSTRLPRDAIAAVVLRKRQPPSLSLPKGSLFLAASQAPSLSP